MAALKHIGRQLKTTFAKGQNKPVAEQKNGDGLQEFMLEHVLSGTLILFQKRQKPTHLLCNFHQPFVMCNFKMHIKNSDEGYF